MNDETLFHLALARSAGEQRSAFLDQACAGDAELRRRLDVLLRAHENPDSFLVECPVEAPPTSVHSDPTSSTVELTESRIGPYKLLQPIGEGGMGTVYMAAQTQPVRRTVALKLIKAGMDSRQVLARFGAERQALALMDHPSIAKVFDAGTTDSGRPYFVMELVKGIPITTYCDERRLTLRERLELAIPVCQAVQHAHQKGIIHRDLKPSNVLIALYDGKPVPKIIDFGVAKATGQRLTDQTLYTEFGAVVGTLEYMSPEQAELNQLDIDTRSDIYSLGVLLYELLTGSTPLERKRLKEAVFLELLRVIREEESPRPSVRLSTTEELPSIAACRHVEPRKLSGLVRGELDWIVMKALEKDRNRRYETATGLAADLRRYLDDEPVQACPPSAWYRFGKFARRNKTALTVAGMLAVTMLAGVGLLTVSNVLITREKNQKEAALRSAKESAKEANDQRAIAIANETNSREQEMLARRRFFAAQTNLAMQAWETGQPARVLELLESLRPKFDQEDLRGFEWYYLWRLCHAGYLSTLRGHTGLVKSVAFSPDGKTLASASAGNFGWAGHDSAVKLWDVATRRERVSLKEAGLEEYTSLAFSPDGRTLAAVGNQSPVKLWDTASGREIGSFSRPSPFVRFFADGKTVVTWKPQAGSGGKDLELWDAATGQEKAILRASPGEEIVSVAVSPDGKFLAAGTSFGVVRLWAWDGARWQDGEPLQGHNYGAPMAYSPDGKTLVVGGSALKSYEVGSAKQRVSFQGHVGPIHSLAVASDGKTLASGGNDRTVRTWDAATGKELTRRPHAGPVLSMDFSPGGEILAAADSNTTITLWSAAPAPADVVLSHGGAVKGLAFTPDGQRLVSSGDAPPKRWDVASGRLCVSRPMNWARFLNGKGISPDAKIQAFEGPAGTVTLGDLETGRQVALLRGHRSKVYVVAFAPDRNTVATVSDDGTAKLWDVATGQSRATMIPRPGGVSLSAGVSAAAFSPDGTMLATGSQFQIVSLWDAATGRERLALQTASEGTGDHIRSVAFSPDGKMLAVASEQGTARLWDVRTGGSRGSLLGHTDSILALVFSPDGKTLVTGSDDRTVKLWDVATGQERLTLKGHTAGVFALAFSPDGKTLATGSGDRTVRLWHTSRHVEATARNNEQDQSDPATAQALSTAGERLWSIGRPEESEQTFRKALTRALKLTNAFPDNPGYRQELARSWLGLGLLLAAGGRTGEAERARREATALLQSLPAKSRQALTLHFFELADLFRASGHADRADAAFRQSVQIDPANAVSWYQRARVDVELGRQKAVGHEELTTHVAMSHNNLAWNLATCADLELRDLGRAYELAKKAVELEPTSGMCWNTLGVVHYRAGDWKAAIEALEKAESLEPDKSFAFNAFFLAMAHWQLGKNGQACKWYDQAVAWLEKNKGRLEKQKRYAEELFRFRAEAAALLEVTASKK